MPGIGKSIKTKVDQWLLGPEGKEEEGIYNNYTNGFHPHY